jgi:malonyl-CoA/methylmalonyl-CoA synthetase
MSNPLFDALFAPLAGRKGPLLILPDAPPVSGDAFLHRVLQMAQTLGALGLQPGDRLALQVAKSPDAFAIYGACVAAGVVLLPLNPAYETAELTYFVQDSAAALVLAEDRAAPGLCDAMPGQQIMGIAAFADMAAGMSGAFAPVARQMGDLAALLYTSGTTGRSKGAMLSHGNLLSNAEVLVDHWRFTAADVLIHALPVFHTHGLFVAGNVALLSGAAMIWLAGFQAEQVLALLPQATVMMGVPTFYTRLLDAPGLTRDATAHLRLFISGSAPLLAETHAEFERRTGHAILERYGMTETNMNTSNPYDGARRAGTVGQPLPGVEVVITDPATGAPLPPGEAGMIELRGPNVFQGYWNMPEKTAQDLRANGFFITGDLGRFDEQGYLHIVGRLKDLIISGGLNIYPKELELLLDEAPGVLESAVVGVPHPDFGEAVVGVLVPRPGHTPDVAAIAEGLRGQVARFKQPKALVIREALPRNAMGKVRKELLRADYAGMFAEKG